MEKLVEKLRRKGDIRGVRLFCGRQEIVLSGYLTEGYCISYKIVGTNNKGSIDRGSLINALISGNFVVGGKYYGR